MQDPHYRARETRELLDRFQRAAARRRRVRLILACALGSALLAVVAVILTLTLTHSAPLSAADSSSTTAPTVVAGSTSTTALTSHTVPLPASTTLPPETTSTAPTREYVVVIDPGHQAKADTGQEPIGPGSSTTKDRVSSGTRSINTGSPESELVLKVALKLRDALEANGISVVMTRTTQDVWISNVERAQVANQAGADLFVRIHADGAAETSIRGILMLYPASIKGWTDDIAAESRRAAQLALDRMVEATGTRSRGMVARSDLTGFNWSDVPVILPEIGLMTNRQEDELLATDEYQDRLVSGLAQAILEFLGVR